MAFRQQPQQTFRRSEHSPRFAAMKTEAQAPKRESGGEEQGFFGKVGSSVMGGLRQVDDSTQAFARDHLLRLPNDGSELAEEAFMSGPRAFLGHSVFKAREGYTGDNTIYSVKSGDPDARMMDNIGIGASRALQGGAITAAGAGLAALTNQFGSQADYQEPNQLSL